MRSYLILRLAGPMQAWGQPTFEGTRPTGRFPTRSGLLGLLGACLGIQRDDTSSLQALSESVQFAVRCDELILDDRRVSVTGLRDYHTVLGAREDYRGLKSHETIQTWREYLCDASFTVALWLTPHATMVISELEKSSIKASVYTLPGAEKLPTNTPAFFGDMSGIGSSEGAIKL